MADEKAELQRQYALIEDAKKSQEQFVKDINSLAERASYDHLVDLCHRHMKSGEVLERTLTMVKGFFRIELPEHTHGLVLDRILENVQKGHYAKFEEHDGVSFALSSLPNSMSIHWQEVRESLMKARADGEG